MSIVELRGVTKSFRKGDETITPLDNVDLDINEGEFVSLMGPSGTGKSTLLNVVSGIDRVQSGTIRINGHRLMVCLEVSSLIGELRIWLHLSNA